MIIQSILFPKKKYSEKEAKSWLVKKGYKHPKPDITEHYLRFRQRPPNSKKKYTMTTIKGGIKFVFMYS